MRNTGVVNTDLHNFSHYIYKVLTGDVMWERLTNIEPEYDMLSDINQFEFVKQEFYDGSEENIYEVRIQSKGKKVFVRGTPVVIIYNPSIDNKFITNKLIDISISMDDQSCFIVCINFNGILSSIENKNYEEVFNFFNDFFKFIIKNDDSAINFAIKSYIDLIVYNLSIDKIKDETDMLIADCMKPIFNRLGNYYNHGSVSSYLYSIFELLIQEQFKKLFYYRSIVFDMNDIYKDPNNNKFVYSILENDVDDIYSKNDDEPTYENTLLRYKLSEFYKTNEDNEVKDFYNLMLNDNVFSSRVFCIDSLKDFDRLSDKSKKKIINKFKSHLKTYIDKYGYTEKPEEPENKIDESLFDSSMINSYTLKTSVDSTQDKLKAFINHINEVKPDESK